MNRIYNFIRRFVYRVAYLIWLRLDYFKMVKTYRFMKKNQYKSIEHNIRVQKELLYNIVKFSIENVPYYKLIAEKTQIIILKDTIFEDIKKFPILTKEILREKGNLFLPLNRKSKYRLNTSGGTTGEPIIFIQDQKYILDGIAATHFIDEIGGYHLGERVIWLWGNINDLGLNSKKKIKSLINRYIQNIYIQNSFKMSDDKIYEYITQINRLKPKVLIGYAHSLYEMAKFIYTKNLKIHKLRSIISTAGVLTKEIKDLCKKAFKCKIINRYGSREVGQIATSCEKTDKLHINMYKQFVEILDKNNNVLKEHQKGEIIITNLSNYGMPLIRYRIGDLGALDYSQCSCGRGLIRLDNVYGRTVGILKSSNGDLIDGLYFIHLFYFRKNVKKFQIIQNKIDEIEINIMTLNKKSLEAWSEEELINRTKRVMGDDCKVNINYQEDIPPSKSGKFQYIISNII